jgi:site-specific DNA-methyltransferase (adenine-specific)
MVRRAPTSTSAFGVGRRENHDSSGFYERFSPPTLSTDDTINPPAAIDQIIVGDARSMDAIAGSSVALVVTSPPYFVGKEYESALGKGSIPGSYLDYLQMLHDVFADCVDKLEPGGRIAVNVANLGRRPYRSLSADVIGILQDDLGLLLRGEIIWQKARGAGGSCAWGSFQSPANPVLRDLTERIVVASKGRFDRALTARRREERDLPSEGTIWKDDFLEATTDVWEMPPESATRVGHPAPFPVALPQRLIELYTYRGDVVLDPFMGSGSTAIAAVRTERRYVGYDTDPAYVEAANARIEAERTRLAAAEETARRVVLPAKPAPAAEDEHFQTRAVREGHAAKQIAVAVLTDCGFELVGENRKIGGGVEVNVVARDQTGQDWLVDVSGAFTTPRAGLRRTDTLWKALGRASVVRAASEEVGCPRYLLLTTDLPPKGSAGAAALGAVRGSVVFDAVEMLSAQGQARLASYATSGATEPEGDLLLPNE